MFFAIEEIMAFKSVMSFSDILVLLFFGSGTVFDAVGTSENVRLSEFIGDVVVALSVLLLMAFFGGISNSTLFHVVSVCTWLYVDLQ